RLLDEDSDCRFWAAWSAVMIGDRQKALEPLTAVGLVDGAHRARAFQLALQAASLSASHRILETVARAQADVRWLIQGSGIAGDSTYIRWLLKQMTQDLTAQVAGEAFSLMTGLDISAPGFERTRPEGFEPGPTDDPDDEDVEMDPDEGLPWP